MLVQLLDYIRKQGVVSTQQLSRFFHIDEAALQPMLNIWINKGAIKPCETSSSCKTSCFKCHKTTPVYYEAQVIES